MNSGTITNMMVDLRSKDEVCPYCSRKKPRHELDCVFRDLNLAEILLEAYLNPSIDPPGIKEIVYTFIKERSSRDFYLDAVCYFLTTDSLYTDLGITENDMVFLVNYIPRYYQWWLTLVHYVVVRKTFFRRIDGNSKSTAFKALETITLLYDIKSSNMGTYEQNQESRNQVKVLLSLRSYIERWMRQKRLT